MNKIVRPSLHEEAVARLRDLIIEGALRPGERLNERELCEQFGISRTPLREALKVMANEGLVVLLPNRGARVTRLTRRDIQDMFHVMGALEALSGELACRRVSEDAVAEIRALHYEMLAAYARRDRREYFRLNQAIHAAILAAADNPVLTTMYASLAARIRRVRYMANMEQERWDQAVREHEQILDALTRRDATRLAAELRAHLEHKCAVVLASGAIEAEEERATAAE
ncbi:GntR family transcriptional regulator [Azospirillum sp. ST 5-10]|uniref:GntR family transcriptional regulator n=1 Tax=unclassified Azospirillum TaxID=2630922 RepID=UPI003F4A235F